MIDGDGYDDGNGDGDVDDGYGGVDDGDGDIDMPGVTMSTMEMVICASVYTHRLKCAD